jgi:hypothetical protein
MHPVGDGEDEAQFGTQVGDPAGDGAGLEHDQGGAFGLEERAQVGRMGGDGCEARVGGLGIVEAGDALELAEVESENRVHPRASVEGSVREMSHLEDTSLEGASRLTWILKAA